MILSKTYAYNSYVGGVNFIYKNWHYEIVNNYIQGIIPLAKILDESRT